MSSEIEYMSAVARKASKSMHSARCPLQLQNSLVCHLSE
jgi:hypothetical protein